MALLQEDQKIPIKSFVQSPKIDEFVSRRDSAEITKPPESVGCFFFKDLLNPIVDEQTKTFVIRNHRFKMLYARGIIVQMDKSSTNWYNFCIHDGTGVLIAYLYLQEHAERCESNNLILKSLATIDKNTNADDLGFNIIANSIKKSLKREQSANKFKIGDTVECYGKYKYHNNQLYFYPTIMQIDNVDVAEKNYRYLSNLLQSYTRDKITVP